VGVFLWTVVLLTTVIKNVYSSFSFSFATLINRGALTRAEIIPANLLRIIPAKGVSNFTLVAGL
jgi:hypothetical protein